MYSLYWDSVIKKGNTVIKLAKDAPAPNTTNIAGNAQHIKVDDDANSDKKFVVLSFIFISNIKLIQLAFRLHFGRWPKSFS